MTYCILAQKWRPQTFYDIVGQKHILLTLINSLHLKRVHHTYLFAGMQGIGKTTIARLFAKGLNCETGISPFPCRKCASCIAIEKGKTLDFFEIDAASRTKVEDIRDILDHIYYLPMYFRYKIYLIDEVHMLSNYSFNALLKILEEPPKHAKFLLATTDLKKIPETVLSRCLQLNFRALSSVQIQRKLSEILKKENISIEFKALELLSKFSKGSMRDALNLSDQAISIGLGKKINENIIRMMLGLLKTEQSISLLKSIFLSNSTEIIEKMFEFEKKNYINWDQLMSEILSILHKIIIYLSIDKKFFLIKKESAEFIYLCEVAKNFSDVHLQFYYKSILCGRKELKFSPNQKIGAEIIFLRTITIFQMKFPNITKKIKKYFSQEKSRIELIEKKNNNSPKKFLKIRSNDAITAIKEDTNFLYKKNTERFFTKLNEKKKYFIRNNLNNLHKLINNLNFSRLRINKKKESSLNLNKNCTSFIIKKNNVNLPTSTIQLLKSYDILRKFRNKIELKINNKKRN